MIILTLAINYHLVHTLSFVLSMKILKLVIVYLELLLTGMKNELQLTCIPANNQRMREWRLNWYPVSAFNKCTHLLLSETTGPPLKIHIDPDAIPRAISIAAAIPKHCVKELKQTLDRDTRLGVLGKTPTRVTSTWVDHMVLFAKVNGSF